MAPETITLLQRELRSTVVRQRYHHCQQQSNGPDPFRCHQVVFRVFYQVITEVRTKVGSYLYASPLCSLTNSYPIIILLLGPGDDNAMTKRAKRTEMKTLSLSEAEQTVRPHSTSNGFQNLLVGDHRDVGDTNALTKKNSKSTVQVISSLSRDGERQRPIPSSRSQPQQILLARDFMDTGSLSKKLPPSSSAPSSLKVKSADRRPVSSSNQKDANEWWSEKTIRPTTSKSNELEHATKPSLDTHHDSARLSTLLSSMIKDEKRLVCDRIKRSELWKNPVAEIPTSYLHSLLKDDEEPIVSNTND